MRGLTKFDDSYFDIYKDKKVRIIPFSNKQTDIANKVIAKVKGQLLEFDIEYSIRGSTVFKISGKGEVEIGVYPKPKDWKNVINKLAQLYGPMEQEEENYARVNSMMDDIEIEIIVLKEHEAVVDIKLHKYLINNPELLKQYEQLKVDNCFSKKQYMIAKNNFLSEVIELIPEDY